ncbi:uncharacterized protein ColSpa_12018 [Colletotrichum spaethianum]|uniref:Uncharacterized protein n=1 Tax=Colletotrichum spaethianum TaxID=700344 RepID=A0AA37PGQ0_9PEZI|nr:uncharacterized protein ColSpa_12018 [Colletotrichum spaethianum]GKT51837.1 hypothetical protein ColSpa_12018 [Colletotrichum spaethianum]
MAPPESMSEYGTMDDSTYIMPYGEFIDRNTWMFDPDAQYNDQPYTAAAADAAADVMNLYHWQIDNPTPTLPTNDSPPVADYSGWSFPYFKLLQLPSPGRASFLRPVNPSSPINHTALTSPSSRDQPYSSHGSSVAHAGDSRYPTPPPPPPPKRRKYNTHTNKNAFSLPSRLIFLGICCAELPEPLRPKTLHVFAPEPFRDGLTASGGHRTAAGLTGRPRSGLWATSRANLSIKG